MTRKRVLLISYHFPPVGGAGVQRPAKFARYLPEHGWDVSVLQAANPSVPLIDESLLADLPDDLLIVKAKTLEPGYAAKAGGNGAGSKPSLSGRFKGLLREVARRALQPDPQILWYPAARKAALELLRQTRHDVILATAPSYSNLVLGASLSRATGVPLVVDYRDEWDLSSAYWENAPRDRISHAIQQRMQRRVLRTASAIVATTEASTGRVASRAAEAGVNPIAECIYNGWDRNDMVRPELDGTVAASSTGRLRLVYTGTLWNLTSIAPLRSALQRLAERRPDLAQRVDLIALGRKTPEQSVELETIAATGVSVDARDYAPHSVAIDTMRSADVLLLLLSDVPGAERVTPAKLFEYMAIARPMLAITPDGETAGIVRSIQPGAWRAADDVAGIAEWLESCFDRPDARTAPEDYPSRIAPYERSFLAGKLARLLDRVTA
jgi:hypothetical protein